MHTRSWGWRVAASWTGSSFVVSARLRHPLRERSIYLDLFCWLLCVHRETTQRPRDSGLVVIAHPGTQRKRKIGSRWVWSLATVLRRRPRAVTPRREWMSLDGGTSTRARRGPRAERVAARTDGGPGTRSLRHLAVAVMPQYGRGMRPRKALQEVMPAERREGAGELLRPGPLGNRSAVSHPGPYRD